LGHDNRSIVNSIVTDIVENSFGKPYLKISDPVFQAIKELKDFNYKYIYDKANTIEDLKYYEKIFNTLFPIYLNHLENNQTKEDIYTIFLNEMNLEYQKNTNPRKVIDYIAGMTDDFIVSQYKKYSQSQFES
jgi:dGTPase